MRIKGMTGLAVRVDVAYSTWKKWAASRLEGQNLPVAELVEELRQRPLFDLTGEMFPLELRCAVPEAEAPGHRALLEALLDLTARLGGRGELAEFALDGEVRCFLWQGKKRRLPVPHEDRRVKTDFVMLQKHQREAVLKYVPPKVAVLRCSCGTVAGRSAKSCSGCGRDYTAPIAIEARPAAQARLRTLRARLVELRIPLPQADVFAASVFTSRNAFEALTQEALLAQAGMKLLDPGELARRAALLAEVETWPRRYRLPNQTRELVFDMWCSYELRRVGPDGREVLERLAREQGHRFGELATVVPSAPGWLAAGEVGGSALPRNERLESVLPALDFVRRFAGDLVSLSDVYLEALWWTAPDLLTPDEQRRCEQSFDGRAIRSGKGLGAYLKRREAKAKSPTLALAALLEEAGDPDVDDDSVDGLKALARAAVEWLMEGRPPELDDMGSDRLVAALEDVKRAGRLPEVVVQRAEEALRHPAPFGLEGAKCWDVQPRQLSEEDEKARAACPECGRRVKPSTVFHIPTLGEGMAARTLRLYECEPCGRALLFARAIKPARPTRKAARAFMEYRDTGELESPPPARFVRWRYERFIARQREGVPLALQLGGLPLSSETHDPSEDMDLGCGHPFIRIRIHTRPLGLQPGFGGGARVGQLCMTPGCKKPDVRIEGDG
ncbi:hypothetical protein LY474_19130 [Myxococcus stipitatus]|uniref:hypothetical protein n=1 Tax=Myxococcus stipitatus TaxID=83455 RepID=UPI001F3A948B|nr:hypothetical protein [Myxococcus stipitatus]MCE9669915.1 hypothetical protein [Myxococcus stipitatus]